MIRTRIYDAIEEFVAEHLDRIVEEQPERIDALEAEAAALARAAGAAA